MRSALELKNKWLAELPLIMARTGMYAMNGTHVQDVCRRLLDELCFLDERDDGYWRDLMDRYGSLGVQGPFLEMFGRDRNCTAEVASVFAEQFHRLGYLAVDRTLDEADWLAFTTAVRERFGTTDVRRSEIVAEFGEPSLVVDRRVLCYVPGDSSGWAFVDCWTEYQRSYVPGEGTYDTARDDDPLVREFRLPADTFESGLHLTLFGKVLRWGPGWWIHHPDDTVPAESQAIAAQLRQIESDDPSRP